MSFKERVTWVMLLIMVLVYGGYFWSVFGALQSGGAVADIEYQGAMLRTVGTVIVLTVVGTVLITVAARGDDAADERDRAIGLRGDWLAGVVLALGALAALGLAMYEAAHFWIANTLLLGLVLAEVVGDVRKLVLYRRGD